MHCASALGMGNDLNWQAYIMIVDKQLIYSNYIEQLLTTILTESAACSKLHGVCLMGEWFYSRLFLYGFVVTKITTSYSL